MISEVTRFLLESLGNLYAIRVFNYYVLLVFLVTLLRQLSFVSGYSRLSGFHGPDREVFLNRASLQVRSLDFLVPVLVAFLVVVVYLGMSSCLWPAAVTAPSAITIRQVLGSEATATPVVALAGLVVLFDVGTLLGGGWPTIAADGGAARRSWRWTSPLSKALKVITFGRINLEKKAQATIEEMVDKLALRIKIICWMSIAQSSLRIALGTLLWATWFAQRHA